MAQHKSAIKRIRQSEKARLRNRIYKSQLKTAIKKLRNLENKEEAENEYKNITSLLDRLVNKGVLHKNNAANKVLSKNRVSPTPRFVHRAWHWIKPMKQEPRSYPTTSNHHC